MVGNIVIALHGDISARAVPFAEGIAQRWGGHLVLLHAIGRDAHTSQAPRGINGLLAVAGDSLLVPVAMANPPQLVALKIGASGFSLKEHQV